MKKNSSIFKFSIVGLTAFLGACAGTYDVQGIATQPDQGSAYASALHKYYVERAAFEKSEGDWSSVDFFASRAKKAAEGVIVAPQNPTQRHLKQDGPAIDAAYQRLTGALAAGQGDAHPEACAQAQTWLEHWMEQAEEGRQQDHIRMARTGYEDAIVKCDVKTAPTLAPAPAAKLGDAQFVVFFDFNAATLTPKARSVIDEIAADIKKNGAASVRLVGRTDTVGSNAYNAALAQKRVQRVADALKAKGVNVKIDTLSVGEHMLAAPTGDNVKNQSNRRVDVTVKH
ncbi:OmpA family protein [Varunaivibrio sulfuroxidans]|uniref:OmpA family protein n=1 Tax=Varunaivibrio sulfuroxidans TaxID=1773489 RepID=A0A4R3JIF8_9PROT|nr:OmpA family protein [Varunaivibrio sulfuroxidans]TCS65173.1 OmpA family protein [Varunaivibrio sulfuroxidans]WES29545.1 OmpA family protein [Varunaivibrio sulfuroxidans]